MKTVDSQSRALIPFLIRSVVCAAAFSLVGIALPACNTTEGVGKDVKSLGKGIEETADEAKH